MSKLKRSFASDGFLIFLIFFLFLFKFVLFFTWILLIWVWDGAWWGRCCIVRLIFVIGIAQPPTRSECLPDRPLLLFVKLIFRFILFYFLLIIFLIEEAQWGENIVVVFMRFINQWLKILVLFILSALIILFFIYFKIFNKQILVLIYFRVNCSNIQLNFNSSKCIDRIIFINFVKMSLHWKNIATIEVSYLMKMCSYISFR